MRTIIAALLFLTATTAAAQTAPPAQPAPAANAPFEQRESWCQKYASWYLERVPAAAPAPDMRPTQRFENELTYCKLDPQEYQRQTLAEVGRLAAPTQG